MLIADEVPLGCAFFDRFSLGAKFTALEEVLTILVSEGAPMRAKAAYLDATATAALTNIYHLIELELEDGDGSVGPWRKLLSSAVQTLGLEPIAAENEELSIWKCSVHRLADWVVCGRDFRANAVSDSNNTDVGDAHDPLPFSYFSKSPYSPNASEVAQCLARMPRSGQPQTSRRLRSECRIGKPRNGETSWRNLDRFNDYSSN